MNRERAHPPDPSPQIPRAPAGRMNPFWQGSTHPPLGGEGDLGTAFRWVRPLRASHRLPIPQGLPRTTRNTRTRAEAGSELSLPVPVRVFRVVRGSSTSMESFFLVAVRGVSAWVRRRICGTTLCHNWAIRRSIAERFEYRRRNPVIFCWKAPVSPACA